MVLQRIALFTVEAETLPCGQSDGGVFDHYFGHAGEAFEEFGDFEVQVDQQVLMAWARLRSP